MGEVAAARVILRASDVVDLQFFLMDVAKRYVVAGGERTAVADAMLAHAAALDYALLLSSEHGDEPLDASSPVAASVRDTMTGATACALDFAATMVAAPETTYGDFMRRFVREGGIFDTVRSLKETGAIDAPVLAFRCLTVTNDLIERRDR